jgi:hypothetical protein
MCRRESYSSSRRQYRSELFSSKTSSVGVRGREPGGCVKAGGGMQEESIFRRTSIHRCLLKNLYPIEDDECLYCPLPVVRFRREWIRDDNPTYASVACPAVKSPHYHSHERRRRRACNYEKLSLARVCNQRLFSPRAWGCGAYATSSPSCGRSQ